MATTAPITAPIAAPQPPAPSRDFVRACETVHYHRLREALMAEIHPSTVIEQVYANEMISAVWRLRRCAALEASLAARGSTLDPMEDPETSRIQKDIDRARAQANRIFAASARQIGELRRAADAPIAQSADQTQSPEPSTATEAAPTPRNAVCRCGSGQKFKRCCGRNAPAVLGPPASHPIVVGGRCESRTMAN